MRELTSETEIDLVVDDRGDARFGRLPGRRLGLSGLRAAADRGGRRAPSRAAETCAATRPAAANPANDDHR